jgi:hypothetical protein
MRRILGVAAPDPGTERAWPLVQVATDMYAGDEALPMSGAHRDYLTHAGRVSLQAPIDSGTYARLDAEFEQRYRAILDGEVDPSRIAVLAQKLLIWGPVRHDRRPLPEVPVAIDDALLAEMAENQLPQVGGIAPDRVLGPWADEPLPRWVRLVAAAVMCFAPEVPPGVPAWARSIKRRPRPDRETCIALRAVARIPPMLWIISDANTVRPHLPFAPHMVPDGPIAGLPDTPAVIGRMVPAPTGWQLVAGLPLVQIPPAGPLVARLQLELLRLRRRERRLTWEDLLRQRGELLYRAASEWLYDALASPPSAAPPWR